MEGGIILNGVLLECVAVVEPFACKDETLLLWCKACLFLDLGLDILDTVGWLDFERDFLAALGLDNDLHLQK